mmetsp:Transcript_12047/g.14348  ORF Transcript_12047/g.14348 Transcript_12047/m.14348 type:complete len:374 (+) Transcript_12047:377-1498(+)|eukprot:CAMPEP_0197848066 /NCGR_PEP_ID=MMETSP1438-20131217/7905_1 /TAXON_ID=1461541 /ORGANISM="Pterosperma sp., Strain CCMP1384" /LENGTH=373 /DNA_ID=CAMNT_0043460193 /DNA_START=377 /DNA_END=1498 /DNA_ORIENTATION=+
MSNRLMIPVGYFGDFLTRGNVLPFASTAVLAVCGVFSFKRKLRSAHHKAKLLTYMTPVTHDGQPVDWDDLQFWTRALERRGGWKKASPDEAIDFHLGVGTEQRGGRIRRYAGPVRKQFHNKQLLFRRLTQGGVPCIPETCFSSDEFLTASQQTPGVVWFFKKAEESRGRGVFPFRQLSDIPASDLAEEGVFQREVPNMMLFPNGCKFDLRVLSFFGPGRQSHVYDTFFIRTTNAQFQSGNLDREVQCTNLSLGGTVYPWAGEGQPLPQYELVRQNIFTAVSQVMVAMRQYLPSDRMHYFGFDFMLDRDMKPWLLEINSTPHLINSNAAGDVDRMLDDFLENVLEPQLASQTSKYDYTVNPSKWQKVFCDLDVS